MFTFPTTLYSGSRYVTSATDYDGTDSAARGADLSTNADTNTGIIKFHFKRDAVSTQQFIWCNASDAVVVDFATDKLRLILKNTGGTTVVSIVSPSDVGTDGNWHAAIAAWDVSNATSTNNWAKLWVDEAELVSDVDIPQSTINNAVANHFYAVNSFATQRFQGCLSEFFLHFGATLDPNIAANRRKFYEATGKPVSLGANGSTPLGVQPLVYFATGHPTPNLGAGGVFGTITGTPPACASSPSD